MRLSFPGYLCRICEKYTFILLRELHLQVGCGKMKGNSAKRSMVMKPKRKDSRKKTIRVIALIACGLMLVFALVPPLTMMWG